MVDGLAECRPGAAACADAEAFDPETYTCVALDGPVDCGPGTAPDGEGGCVLDSSACGPSTRLDPTTGLCVRGVVFQGECADPPVLEGSLRENTTLSEGGCYVVRGELRVRDGARLLVQPGVTLVFEEDAELQIEDTSALNALGEEERPIRMVGAVEQPGHWRGVTLAARGIDNHLEWVQIHHTGSAPAARDAPAAGLLLLDGSRLRALRHVTVTDGAGFGLYMNGDVSLGIQGEDADEDEGDDDGVAFADNDLGGNAAGPARVEADHLGFLDATSRYGGSFPPGAELPVDRGEALPAVVVTGDASAEAIWRRLDAPYRFIESCRVTGRLEIEAGVLAEFAEQTRLEVDQGTLEAIGTAEAPIVLRGDRALKGYWDGLTFKDSDSILNALRHVHISDAGRSALTGRDRPAALTLSMFNGEPLRLRELRHVRLTHNLGYGLSAAQGAVIESLADVDPTPAFGENVMADNDVGPAWVGPGFVEYFAAAGSERADLLDDGQPGRQIHVAGGRLSEETVTWRALEVPYLLTEDLEVRGGSAFTIERGVEVAVAADVGIEIEDSAFELGTRPSVRGLVLRGTRLHGEEAIPGYWRGVRIGNSPGGNNAIRGLLIEDAGGRAWGGRDRGYAVVINPAQGARLSVDGLTVSNSGGGAVYIDDTVLTTCLGVDLEGAAPLIGGDPRLWAQCSTAVEVLGLEGPYEPGPDGSVSGMGYIAAGQVTAVAIDLDQPSFMGFSVSRWDETTEMQLVELSTGEQWLSAQAGSSLFLGGFFFPAGQYLLLVASEVEVSLFISILEADDEPVAVGAEGEPCDPRRVESDCVDGLLCHLAPDGDGICRVPVRQRPGALGDDLFFVDPPPAGGFETFPLQLDAPARVLVRVNGLDGTCVPLSLMRVAPEYLDDPADAHVLYGPARAEFGRAAFPEEACVELDQTLGEGEHLFVLARRAADPEHDGAQVRVLVEPAAPNGAVCGPVGAGCGPGDACGELFPARVCYRPAGVIDEMPGEGPSGVDAVIERWQVPDLLFGQTVIATVVGECPRPLSLFGPYHRGYGMQYAEGVPGECPTGTFTSHGDTMPIVVGAVDGVPIADPYTLEVAIEPPLHSNFNEPLVLPARDLGTTLVTFDWEASRVRIDGPCPEEESVFDALGTRLEAYEEDEHCIVRGFDPSAGYLVFPAPHPAFELTFTAQEL